MYLNGPTLFGKDWDSSQDQLTAWAQLAGRPAPTMVAHLYPHSHAQTSSPKVVPVAPRSGSNAP